MRINSRALMLAGYVVTAFSGMGLGVGLTIRFLDKEYEQNLAKEVDQAKDYYNRLHKRGPYSDPIALIQPDDVVETIIEDQKYAKMETVDKHYENVFVEASKAKVFDLGEEVKTRTADRPYVISADEYFRNDTNYEQENLNYYDKDGVLCHENDEEIIDGDDIVGDDNLLRFGDGSNDPNVVYVRNDRREREYEIIRTRGSYAEIVHGFIEHSDKKRKVPKKFRRDDE